MKKVLLLLTILFCPLSVFAYSSYVIPGGENIGINIENKGIMIIGFYKIDGRYNKGKPTLEVGDYIMKINNEEVSSLNDMTNIIENASDKRNINLEIDRKGKTINIKMPLILSDGKYKTGLFVKDSIKGIGTLSYIDPNTFIFGALGHEVVESETGSIVEIKTGTIFESYVTSINKSVPGNPGSKYASFAEKNIFGSIFKNSKSGIYGIYSDILPSKEVLKVGSPIIGPAYMQTVIEGNEVNKYEIEIRSINENSKTKNITFIVTDEELLNKTGGVIQGMSGSPIIQNNMIVGVVTHVIVDNPSNGYGILITNMLENGET